MMWRLWTDKLDPSLLLTSRLVPIFSNTSTSTTVVTTNPIPPQPRDDAVKGEPDNQHPRVKVNDYYSALKRFDS